MPDRFRVPEAVGEKGKLVLGALPPEKELRHFKNITSSLMKDALNLWAELWEEFEDRVISGVAVLPEAERGFKPRCGWPEFLERMWLLKHYLDFVKSFSEQGLSDSCTESVRTR